MSTQPRNHDGVPDGGQRRTAGHGDPGIVPLQSAWPSVTTEPHRWQDLWTVYEASVVPNIDGLDVAETLDPLRAAAVGAAQQSIMDFDARMTEAFGGMELGTVQTVLLRSEAASSSQIEHLTASAKQLALAQIGESSSVNAQTVAANVDAMEQAARLDELSTDAAVSMQGSLLGETGLFVGVRQEQVWIGTRGSTPVGADFIPPFHDRVPESLDDLWRFANRPSTLPLAQIAVAHAQFETIHPFVDGNGRVGRALVHKMLRRSGLASHVTVPLSAGLLAYPEGYVAALTAYRAGDPRPVVDEFVRASQHAAGIGTELIAELRAVRTDWASRVNARRDSVAWKIVDDLVGQPAVTADLASRRHGVSAVAARTAIAGLVAGGVLRKVSTGRRNQVWVAPEVTACFDRIAVLIGRRRE